MDTPPTSEPPFAHLPCVDRFVALVQACRSPDAPGAPDDLLGALAALVPDPRPAAQCAHLLRATVAELHRVSPRLGTGPLRALLAAVLLRSNVEARVFEGLAQRDHDALVHAGVADAPATSAIATAVWLILAGPHPLTALQVMRIKHLAREMERHQWWLAGPRSLPMAVLLAAERGDVAVIAERAATTYARARATGLLPGEHLHRACHWLTLTGLAPEVAAARLLALVTAFRARGGLLGEDQIEAMALLCQLDHDPALLARVHQACAARLSSAHPPLRTRLAPVLAADLACLELLPSVAPATEPAQLHPPHTLGEARTLLTRLHRHHALTTIIHADALYEASLQAATAPI